MAIYDWPNDAWIVDQIVAADVPGQTIHEIPSTGGARVLTTGYGRWRGTTTIGARYQAEAAEIEATLMRLNGAEHALWLPVKGTPLVEVGGDRSVTQVSAGYVRVSGVRSGDEFPVGGYGYLTGGDFEFAFRVIEWDEVRDRLRFWPARPVVAGTQISATRSGYIKARSEDGPPNFRVTPDWAGPWAWQWSEVVE